MLNQASTTAIAARARYVLITPARNEQEFIEATIKSVLGQSLLPQEWVIVSDSSKDRTDEIVQRYAERVTFLRFVRVESQGPRNFSAKVAAFQAGARALSTTNYDYIGNLDADVSFEADYFERLLRQFAQRPELGVGGGLILERIGDEFHRQNIHRHSVAGAVQLFRRDCFEAIGGYTPVPSGCVDAAAEIMARSQGWEAETFPQLEVLHHRRVRTGAGSVLATRFRQGKNHALLGYHPLFQMLSSAYQVAERPYLLGALLVSAGYIWGSLGHQKKILPNEVVRFLRGEQIQRIKSLRKELSNRAGGGGSTGSLVQTSRAAGSADDRSCAMAQK